MILQLTDFAVDLLQTEPIPTLTSYSLVDEVGIVPTPDPTGLVGNQVFSGTPSAPEVTSPSTLRYSIILGDEVGPFSFGGVALYVGTELFAYGYSGVLFDKLVGEHANEYRLDIYLTSVGVNYNMWMNFAESSNSFHLAKLSSVNALPPSRDARPNAYVIPGYDSRFGSFLAYTDKVGLWNFDAYKFRGGYDTPVTIVSSTPQSVTIVEESGLPDVQPDYVGEIILQFTSGEVYGTCRYVTQARFIGGLVEIAFDAPVFIQPIPGDTFILCYRSTDTLDDLPIATYVNRGVVQIGSGLTIDTDGIISVDIPSVVGVMTINGEAPGPDGNITLDLSGSVKTVNNEAPDATGNIEIDVGSVKMVNGQEPDIDGNIDLELPYATETESGVVKVGQGLAISADGQLYTKLRQHVEYAVFISNSPGANSTLLLQPVTQSLRFKDYTIAKPSTLVQNIIFTVQVNGVTVGYINLHTSGDVTDTLVFPDVHEGDTFSIIASNPFEEDINITLTFTGQD